jgi:hypothetical protein
MGSQLLERFSPFGSVAAGLLATKPAAMSAFAFAQLGFSRAARQSTALIGY